jgi:hypothetical protein
MEGLASLLLLSESKGNSQVSKKERSEKKVRKKEERTLTLDILP